MKYEKMSVGVAQISCMAKTDLDIAKSKLKEYLKKARKEQGLNMLFFMLTDIMSETTELLCEGDGAERTAKEAFGVEVEEELRHTAECDFQKETAHTEPVK